MKSMAEAKERVAKLEEERIKLWARIEELHKESVELKRNNEWLKKWQSCVLLAMDQMVMAVITERKRRELDRTHHILSGIEPGIGAAWDLMRKEMLLIGAAVVPSLGEQIAKYPGQSPEKEED